MNCAEDTKVEKELKDEFERYKEEVSSLFIDRCCSYEEIYI